MDKDDNVVPTAGDMVFFAVKGPGRIAALGSADPKNTEPYRGDAHSVWRGRCLVIVQPTGETGDIELRARADGLNDAALTVTAKSPDA